MNISIYNLSIKFVLLFCYNVDDYRFSSSILHYLHFFLPIILILPKLFLEKSQRLNFVEFTIRVI